MASRRSRRLIPMDHHLSQTHNSPIPRYELVDRIEKLIYTTELGQLAPFLSSLGPAPNLKVLYLRPELTAGIEEPSSLIRLPTVFSGCLPSLRHLTLTSMVAWPVGLFRGLVSFECGALDHRQPIPPIHVLDAFRESPSIELIRLVGYCALPFQSLSRHSRGVPWLGEEPPLSFDS